MQSDIAKFLMLTAEFIQQLMPVTVIGLMTMMLQCNDVMMEIGLHFQ